MRSWCDLYAPHVAKTEDSAETTQAKLERLQQLRDEALHAGSGKAVERQHAQGKLLARERLLKLLEGLPDQGREVLACRFLLDLSEDETAAALDVPLGTVKSRSARALERLREAYGPGA